MCASYLAACKRSIKFPGEVCPRIHLLFHKLLLSLNLPQPAPLRNNKSAPDNAFIYLNTDVTHLKQKIIKDLKFSLLLLCILLTHTLPHAHTHTFTLVSSHGILLKISKQPRDMIWYIDMTYMTIRNSTHHDIFIRSANSTLHCLSLRQPALLFPSQLLTAQTSEWAIGNGWQYKNSFDIISMIVWSETIGHIWKGEFGIGWHINYNYWNADYKSALSFISVIGKGDKKWTVCE